MTPTQGVAVATTITGFDF